MVVLAESKTLVKSMETIKKKTLQEREALGSPQSPAAKPLQQTSEVVIMDGMSASETTMIRRLAGNDPLIRKKTVKKLRKWLSAIAQRTPDTLGCFHTSRNALFYLMIHTDDLTFVPIFFSMPRCY